MAWRTSLRGIGGCRRVHRLHDMVKRMTALDITAIAIILLGSLQALTKLLLYALGWV